MSEMRNKPVGWQTNTAEEKTREFKEQLQELIKIKHRKKNLKKKNEKNISPFSNAMRPSNTILPNR